MSREVTTHRLALRLARKLRKEAGLEQRKIHYPWVLPEVTSEMLMQNTADKTGEEK